MSYLRESQNVVASRAVTMASTNTPLVQRQSRQAVKTPPVAVSRGDILRCGMQNIGDAVLGP